MSEKANTILSPIEQAFVAAITWDKSDSLKKYKGIMDTPNISTLSDYLGKHRLEHRVGQDVIDSQKLKRTYVVPIDVTRMDGSTFKLNIVVDSTGRDLAIVPLNIDGKEEQAAFKLADKLRNRLMENKKALGNVVDEKTKSEVLDIKSLDEMAEKLAKGEKLVADNPKEALEEIKDKDSDAKQEIETEEERKEREEQEEAEENIPDEYKDKIREACEKAGVDITSVKQAMIVRNPKSITNAIEGENLSENGGEIVVIQLKSGIEKNDNILVQGDRIDKTGKYDEELSRRFDSSDKFGATVEDAETSQDLVITHETPSGEIIEINLDEEPINSKLTDLQKLEVQEQIESVKKEWEIDIEHSANNEEKVAAYENANNSLEYLESEYAVVLDPIQEEFEKGQEEVEAQEEEEEKEQEDKEQEDDGYGDYIDHYGSNHELPNR